MIPPQKTHLNHRITKGKEHTMKEDSIFFNKSPYLRMIFRILFFTVGLYLLLLLGKGLWFLFSPFLLALGLAAVIHPKLRRMEALFLWQRQKVIFWVLGFFFLSVTAFLVVVLPYLWREFLRFFLESQVFLDDFLPYLGELEETVENYFPFLTTNITEELANWSKSLLYTLIDQGGDRKSVV